MGRRVVWSAELYSAGGEQWSAKLYLAGGELASLPKALGCMVVASADIINRAFWETPMRASPADCKSALRLGGALCLPKSSWLHGGG